MGSIIEKELTFCTNSLISKVKRIDLTVTLIDGLTILREMFESVFGINHSDIEEIISNINEDEANFWTLEKYLKTLAGVDGITINTIHQSKGLEYEVVFVNGVSENKIPYQKFLERIGNEWIYEPLTIENIESGRTKLYVGMSRAKAILFLIHNWKPSMFIPLIRATNN